jgi:hypothetical protein
MIFKKWLPDNGKPAAKQGRKAVNLNYLQAEYDCTI